MFFHIFLVHYTERKKLCSNYFNIFTSLDTFIFTLLIIFFAFVGDIFESFYKRRFNIKNSSKILPGHGGIFDRLDGFVMSSNALLAFSYFI